MASDTRLRGVEGLRAVAALSVLGYHAWLYGAGDPAPGTGTLLAGPFRTLQLGVALFFALSGFLLYRPYARSILHGRPRPRTGRYLRNRALRVLPAYWGILLLVALVLQTANVRDAEGAVTIGALDDPLRLLGAMLLVNAYVPATLIEGIGPAWSLAVEAVFYLLLPLLALAGAATAARTGRRVRSAFVPAVLVLGLGLSGKFVAGVVVPGERGYDATWHSVLERSFWAQADLFAFGMALAVVYVLVEDGRVAITDAVRRRMLLAGGLLFVACAATLGGGQLSAAPQNTGVGLAAALAVGVVVLPGRPGERAPWRRRLEWRPLAVLGLWSYSIFLWNEPVVHWLARNGVLGDGWRGVPGNLVIVGCATIALAAVSYRLLEAPALRRKRPVAAGPTTHRPVEAQALGSGGQAGVEGGRIAPAGEPPARQ